MWFFLALCSMLLWGGADLFYKTGADESDRYSHLRTTAAVGLVMGLHALFTLVTGAPYDFTIFFITSPSRSAISFP